MGMTEGAIIRLLCEGEPKPKTQEEIQTYVQYVGRSFPIEELAAPLLAFVRGQEQRKPRQASRVDGYKIRRISASGRSREYLQALESICRIYRVATGFADTLLYMMFHPSHGIGSVPESQSSEFNDVLYERSMSWSGLYVGLAPSPKPKKWKLWRRDKS